MSFIVSNYQDEKFEFDRLSFETQEKIFKLQGNGNEIIIRYEPKILDTSFQEKEMVYFFFQNAYLNAENNIFQIFKNKRRIGWIFPIQSLVSNENDFSENIHFAKYKFCAYNEILKRGLASKRIDFNSQESYSLIDFFDENIIIFCVSLETLDDPKIDISDLLPSFAIYGYYIYDNENTVIHKDIEKASALVKYYGEECLQIEDSKIKLSEHNFLKTLYFNYLKTVNDKVLRFFMLYQVIEYFLDKEFNLKFDLILKSFEDKKIDKNTFREKMNKSSSERSLIRKLSEFIKDDDLIINFKRDGKLFLESFSAYEKEDVGDIIYDIRNLLIHRYRDIDGLDIEKIKLFQILTNQLEQVVNNYMINYNR